MKSLLTRLRNKLLAPVENALCQMSLRLSSMDTGIQMVLKNQYKMLSIDDLPKYSFDEVGFRVYSQNSEDGILLFIFSLIGITNKRCLEICAGNGIQNNTANLIINHGWYGLLFEGNLKLVEEGKQFYKNHPATFSFPPQFVHAWITKTNINNLIFDNGMEGEIDLLSLDVDGVDYWLWDALHIVSPRVVVAEIQCIWENEKSVTVPYADEFETHLINGFGIYSGASLLAFVKLARKKGYRLIGVEKYGFNAFFMRNDVGIDLFPEKDVSACVNLPFVQWARKEFLPLVKDMDWQEV